MYSFVLTCHLYWCTLWRSILIHSMIFNFFHTFSSISRDMKIVTLNEIHPYIQNFMLYKMIYFSSHKFAFFKSPFFAILRIFSSITREICVQIKNKVHHVNQLIEADLMMCIHMTLSKKKTLHSTPHTPLNYSKYSFRC